MEYCEIIHNNRTSHSSISWWPLFAFHYTDVTNAVNILSTGMLFSRMDAKQHNLMSNDNASRQVIDMTSSGAVSLVRFYFRPLTPTQYYNEGYKHPALRYDGDEMANIPVPVFFLFDLESVLQLPNTQFSETSLAGSGTELHSGTEKFSKLNFDAIYSNGPENYEKNMQYRHAEIVYRGAFPIQPTLRAILCRSSQDQTTLLNLLKEQDLLAFAKYSRLIKVYKKDTFQNNGLSVERCMFLGGKLSVSFSDSYEKKRYTDRIMQKTGIVSLKPIGIRIECCWYNTRGVIHQEFFTTEIDYNCPRPIVIKNMPQYANAREIGVKIFFDDKLVCYYRQAVDSAELIK